MDNKYFVIDFDSTFIKVETLDILGAIALDGREDKEERLQKIADITNSGMNGDSSFRASLVSRIDLLAAHKSHLEPLIEELKGLVTPSFEENKEFLKTNAAKILIVSSGFKEFIAPVVADFGIPAENVFANTFTFDGEGNIVGFDEENPLSKDQGKVKLMEGMGLEGEVSVIGDGFTDYEIRQAGYAQKFFAFVENVSRDKVVKHADVIANNFNDVLKANNL